MLLIFFLALCCWVGVVRTDILILFMSLKGVTFSVSPLRIMSTKGFFVDTLYQIDGIPCICWGFCCLIMNGCWVLSNAFSISIQMIIWFSTLVSIQWIRLFAVWMLSWPCILRINTTCSSCVWSFLYIVGLDLPTFH